MWAEDRASQALGMTLDDVGPGTATLRMTVREDMVNGHDIGHGGLHVHARRLRLRVRLQLLQPPHGRRRRRDPLPCPDPGRGRAGRHRRRAVPRGPRRDVRRHGHRRRHRRRHLRRPVAGDRRRVLARRRRGGLTWPARSRPSTRAELEALQLDAAARHPAPRPRARAALPAGLRRGRRHPGRPAQPRRPGPLPVHRPRRTCARTTRSACSRSRASRSAGCTPAAAPPASRPWSATPPTTSTPGRS